VITRLGPGSGVPSTSQHFRDYGPVLGVSQVGADREHVDSCLRHVVSFIEELGVAELGAERLEFLHY